MKRAIGFYDSAHPDSPLASNVPAFITGSFSAIPEFREKLFELVPFPPTPMPGLLAHGDDLPVAEFAANVGLTITAGRRPWQRWRTRHFKAPSFRFLPGEFGDRPRPLRAAAIGVAAVATVFLLGTGLDQVMEVRRQVERRQGVLQDMDRRVDIRTAELRSAGEIETRISTARTDAEAIFAATGAITTEENGFSNTLTVVKGLLPRGVILGDLDDDGSLVMAKLSASTTAVLIELTRALEAVPSFSKVGIRSLTRGEDDGSSQAPAIPGLAGLLAFNGGDDAPPLSFEGLTEIAPQVSTPDGDPLANFFTLTLEIFRSPDSSVQDETNSTETESVSILSLK
jgi:hypothetical protein